MFYYLFSRLIMDTIFKKKLKLCNINDKYLELLPVDFQKLKTINQNNERVVRGEEEGKKDDFIKVKIKCNHMFKGEYTIGYVATLIENEQIECNVIKQPKINQTRILLIGIIQLLKRMDPNANFEIFSEDYYLVASVPEWLRLWNETHLYIPSFNLNLLFELNELLKNRTGKVIWTFQHYATEESIKLKESIASAKNLSHIDDRDSDRMCYGCGIWQSDYHKRFLTNKINNNFRRNNMTVYQNRFYLLGGHFTNNRILSCLPKKIIVHQNRLVEIYLCDACYDSKNLFQDVLGTGFQVIEKLNVLEHL